MTPAQFTLTADGHSRQKLVHVMRGATAAGCPDCTAQSAGRVREAAQPVPNPAPRRVDRMNYDTV